MKIKLEDIHVNEDDNCRRSITAGSVGSLATSIEEKGLLQPVLVRPGKGEEAEPYILVAGFRRIKAHQVLGWTEIEATLKDMTKIEAYFINFSENLDREDLTIVEEADFVSKFARMGMTREEIAKKIGKSMGWVQPRLYLHKLPQDVKELAEAGVITAEHIRTLYSCEDEEELWAMIRRIKSQSKRDITKGKIILRRPAKTRKGRGALRIKRKPEDAERLIDHMMFHSVPFGLHTKALAWMAGNISDDAFAIAIQTYCTHVSHLYTLLNDLEGCDDEAIERCLATLDALGVSKPAFYEVPKNGFPERGEFPEEEQINENSSQVVL